MCLTVSASSFLIDAGTSARPASGNWAHWWCCSSEGKQFIRDLQNEMSSGVLQTTRLFHANFQFTSTASWSWKSFKKFQLKDKRKRKRNVEVLLQLRKKLVKIVHGCRYSLASDKWADCSTVLISMRAVIESAKFEKKSRKTTMQQGRKAKKKCYCSSERNSSGLCIVAGVQWHHTNELTVVLSSKVHIWKKKKKRKKNNTTEEGKKVKPKIEN